MKLTPTIRNMTDAELLHELDVTQQMSLVAELAQRLGKALNSVNTEVPCPACGVGLRCDITEDSVTLERAE